MTLSVDIWSDVGCPWCYIGKARFLSGLAAFAHRDEVEIRFHSFELDPSAEPGDFEPVLQRLADKYGVTPERAEAMEARVRTAAHDEGLAFDGERLHGSTFDLHRLLHFALDHGRQLELVDLVFETHFGGTANVFDHEVLVDLAARAGLDRIDAAAVLLGDEYADAVRADEALAEELGVTGVPFFVVGARYAVSGGQDPAVFTDVLQRAWDDRVAAETTA